MLVEMCLAPNYYIFSAYFNKFHNHKTQLDEYPDWHDISDLREESELKNIRPLQLVPVVSLDDNGQHELWATDSNYRLCSLRHGSQGKEGESDKNYSILAHSNPIHSLSDENYKLKFPPLPMLAKLTQGGTSYEDLCENIKKISKKVNQKDLSYKLTTISLDQLAEPFEAKINGGLTNEQEKYNAWLMEVKEKGEPLKGFILPTVSTLVVVFSHADYQNAIVSLHSYDEFGKDKFDDKLISRANVFKSKEGDEDSKPCAIFHLSPDEIDDGLYTISVKVNSETVGKSDIPNLFVKSNIKYESNGLKKEYSYELREYIKFNSDSPLGKLAIVNGDMISLEETLIYQFPQYLNGMKRYLSNDKGAEGASSPTLNSLSTLKSIRDASVQFGVDSLIGGLQGQYIEAGKQAALNSVSQVFWDSVNNDMPEALRATGELYHGIFTVKDAWEHYSKIFNNNLTYAERGLGARALFSEKVLNISQGKEFLQGFVNDFEHKDFRSLSGRVAETWNGGLSGLADNGLNFISTAQSMKSLYDNYQNLIDAEKKTENARKDLSTIAGDYLDKIPVYRENVFQDAKKINEALACAKEKIADSSKSNEDQAEAQDQVELMTDEGGTGIKVLFHFNSRKRELDENKGVIDVLVEALKSERKLRIEIEGHACQVSSDAINMRVSKERAENAKALFPEELHQFITVRAYGESAPIYIPDDPKDIRRDNPKLAVNRRVVIKIYLVSLDVVYSPSRFGYQAMERYRLSSLDAMKNEDDAETALQLAILDSFLNVAQFIPVLAPFARGLMLASASGDVVKSALTVLDETLFDHNIKEYFKNVEKINSLVNLSRLNMEMLREIKDININLNQSHSTYEDVEKFLKDKKTNKELLKRFKLRAFALNGLMQMLAWIKFNCDEINQESLEKYKVREYLSNYIFSDDWKLNAMTQNLGLAWINGIRFGDMDDGKVKELENIRYDVYNYASELQKNNSLSVYVAPLPIDNKICIRPPDNYISGAFNRVFPVQTKLFEQGDESLFVEFANNFSIIKGAIREDNIGFCRLLIADPNSENWKTYHDWLGKNRSNRISPYHKVKLQLVLNTKYDQVMAVKLGYDRIDGLWNLDGPSYEALIYPMKITDFTCDPGGELAEYFEKQQSETLSSVEFTPFYNFGEAKIFGIKPLTSKGRIIFNEFIHDLKESATKTFHYYNKLMLSLDILEEDKEVSDFERYVNEGGFRSMKYRLWISDSDGDFKMYLPKWFSDQKYGTKIIRLLNKDIKVGVHSENKSEVTVYRRFGEKALHLREKDTLHELFTLTTDTKNSQPVPIIEDISTYVVGIKSKETGLNMFTKSGKLNDFYLSKHRLADRSSFADLTPIDENPTSIFVMFLAEKDNIEHYKTTNLAWDKLDMSLQLILGMDDAVFSAEKINHGPSFRTALCFQGKLSFSEYYENMNKSHGTNYEVWRWEDEISDGGKVHYSDELQSFVKDAMDKIKSESDDLDESKIYTMYAMEVPLSYFSPTGKKVNGLRPFGDILSSGTLTLSLAVSQSDTANQDVYSGLSEIGVEIQPIGNGLFYAPWLQEPESEKDMNRDAFERWKLLSKSEKRTLVQHWIKEQRTVLEAPADPDPSLLS